MNTITVKLRGGRHLWVNRDGGVCAQRGLVSQAWIVNGPLDGWLSFPFVLVQALWFMFGPEGT